MNVRSLPMVGGSTASGLERLAHCPPSGLLALQVRESRDSGDRGNVIHAFSEEVLNGHFTREAALARVPKKWRDTCARLDWHALLEDMQMSTVRAECAYSVNAETGEVAFLGRSLGRRYPPRAWGIIPGTNDIEGTLEDGMPVVCDLKTGWREVTPCERNWQARFHAYARHKVTGSPFVVVRILYVAEDGSVRKDEHAFGPSDHADFLADLRRVLRSMETAREHIAMGVLDVSKGDWCHYCPSYTRCPAQTEALRALLPTVDAIEAARPIGELTPEQAGAAWEKLEQIKPLVKLVDEALRDYAAELDIPLHDGRVVTAIQKSGKRMTQAALIELATRLGATEEDIEACRTTSTWTEVRAVKRSA